MVNHLATVGTRLALVPAPAAGAFIELDWPASKFVGHRAGAFPNPRGPTDSLLARRCLLTT